MGIWTIEPEEAKKAIERINDHIMVHRIYEPHSIRIWDALQMAKKALRKQIPEKIEPNGVGFEPPRMITLCGTCYRSFEKNSTFDVPWRYCPWCGQAIDWEE